MRKRGWILLLATLPVWIYIFIGWQQYQDSKHIGGSWYVEDMPVPLVLQGAGWALILLTPTALALLLFDFISWLRARRHGKPQPS